jgi:lysophospholipase L1-like esterase
LVSSSTNVDECRSLANILARAGTNDAVLPDDSPTPVPEDTEYDTGRSVPLAKYVANLNKMIDSFTDSYSEYHLPGVRIALLTPPPVVLSMREPGQAKVDLDHTRKYKDKCLSVGKQWSRKSGGRVQPVDCWKAITDVADGEKDDALRPFFTDGVHLSPNGYQVVFDELMRIIKKNANWKHLDPANIKATVPRYNAVTDDWEWDYEPTPVQERKD